MILGDMKNAVKRQFGDESGVQITDDDVTRWTNDGQRAIVLSNERLLQTTGTIDAVAGQMEYSLPADLLTLQSLTYRPTGMLSYSHLQGYPLRQFDEYINGYDGQTFGQGIPSIYTVFASLIKLFPVPTDSPAAAIKVFYNRMPIDLANDSDIIDLPVIYQNALQNYVLQQAYQLDEDWIASEFEQTSMQTDLQVARGRDEWANQETYPTITVLNDDKW